MNEGARFRRASDLFERVRSLPIDKRDAFLRDTCADDETLIDEVKRLLGHHDDTDGALDEPMVGRTSLERITAMALATDDELPEKIGRYLVREKLGEGGMGVVYLAEQESPRRDVAVKVIRPGFAGRELLKRFELEAAVLGRLQHPGIAQIYEAGVHEDPVAGPRPFFAMEFVDGSPLDEYARRRSPSIRERLGLFTQICDAVHYAHQKGVIHRDLKPSNLFIAESVEQAPQVSGKNSNKRTTTPSILLSAHPKVLDFGVARATDSDVQVTSLQTDAGQLIGTLPYMSPEQVTGSADHIDTRSDVYALGVVLYELLSGNLPHDLKDCSLVSAAKVIAEQEPAPLRMVSRVPRMYSDILTTNRSRRVHHRRGTTCANSLGATKGWSPAWPPRLSL